MPLSDGSIGSYVLEESFPNLSFPAAVLLTAVPGENRLVALTQDGRVHAFVDNAATTTADTVLDLRSRVDFGGERGLLGLAFDPDFVTNRYLYVHLSLAGTSSP
ncbi:MAG: glucose sorbosone dehydrogenase, partial [Pseudomonadota bacterium]